MSTPRPARLVAGALSSVLVLAALSGSAGRAFAQAPPPSFDVSRQVDSGWVQNTGGDTATIASFPVVVAGASWMRLVFEEIRLPERGAHLRITSVRDGGQQVLDARACAQWRNATAYFNGEDVQVEIVAEARSGRCRVVLASVTAGVPPIPSFSQCGLNDDRVLSNDARVARTMPVGCTAWMIDDCSHNFLTAGHCSGPTLQVVQFDVPLSNGDGSVNHPPPEHQYTVDVGSKQSSIGGMGDDWGYFGVFPNPVTGLRPYQRQQATFELAADAPAPGGAVTTRVTGYGADVTPPEHNQVQQTATGSYVSYAGSTIGYRTDTESGNSGSPVVWEQTNEAIGIHTHGGCSSLGGANTGTAISHVPLQVAIANPVGECECRGESSTYCTGKVNSQGCLETISATGTPSLSAGAGSFVIGASGILSHKLGIMFYGFAPASTPFMGGWACIGGPLRRSPALNSGGTPGPVNCSGTFQYDMGARIASQVDPALVLGANVFAQFYSRDMASPSGPYGLTNGLQFTIGP